MDGKKQVNDEQLVQTAGGGALAGTGCPCGCSHAGDLNCRKCTMKTAVDVTLNGFVIYECDLGMGTYTAPKETNITC